MTSTTESRNLIIAFLDVLTKTGAITQSEVAYHTFMMNMQNAMDNFGKPDQLMVSERDFQQLVKLTK